MSAWTPFSDYDLWKTREPDYPPDPSEYCGEPDCKREAEYDGLCEFHFSLRQEEQALDDAPVNEWGMLEIITERPRYVESAVDRAARRASAVNRVIERIDASAR